MRTAHDCGSKRMRAAECWFEMETARRVASGERAIAVMEVLGGAVHCEMKTEEDGEGSGVRVRLKMETVEEEAAASSGGAKETAMIEVVGLGSRTTVLRDGSAGFWESDGDLVASGGGDGDGVVLSGHGISAAERFASNIHDRGRWFRVFLWRSKALLAGNTDLDVDVAPKSTESQDPRLVS